MNEFINKKSGGRRPRVSIDGVSPTRKKPAKQDSLRFDGSPSPAKPQKSPQRVDDFKRQEVVRSTPATPAMQPSKPKNHLASETENIKSTKRRFGFLRKDKNHSKLDGIVRTDKKSRRRKRMKIAGVACVILLVAGAFGYGYLKNIFGGGGGAAALQENVDPSKLRGEGDGRVNILLMGRGGEGYEAPDLTDTMILVSIDPINKEAGIVSIPRDLYVSVPGHGSMKINEAFYTGKASVINNSWPINDEVKHRAEEKGYEVAKETVERVLGIPIHYRGMIDFKGFKKAVDTVGGVDVNVPEDVKEQMRFDGKPYMLNVKKGWKHFDGFEALAYTRSRKTSSNGDFSRSERQRLVIVALKDKIFSLGTFSNPAKAVQLLDNFSSHVQTDFGFSDINRLYEIFQEIDSSKISSIDMVTPPNDYLTTSNIGGLSVVLPKAGADNYKDIHSYIRNTLKDGFLKSENAKIMILNGTNRTGLATKKADELRSYGYNIGTVTDAPKSNYSNTVLVDLRNGEKKYTKRYLEQRFGTMAVGSLPDGSIQPEDADFVIILGNDTRASR